MNSPCGCYPKDDFSPSCGHVTLLRVFLLHSFKGILEMKADVDHVALECLKQQNGVLAAIALECVLQEHRLDWKCILFYSRKALIENYFWPPE